MPNLSLHLFDNVLKFLSTRQTKIHYRYLLRSAEAETDFQARMVIEKLLSNGLISKDYKDYYKITLIGRDVADDNGGYRNFSDAMKYHSLDTELSNAIPTPIDYIIAKKNNPDAIGYTSEPMPFGGLYSENNKPFHDESFAESQRQIELEQWQNEQPFQTRTVTPTLPPTRPVEDKSLVQKFIDMQDSPKINQRVAFWAGIAGIISTLITVALLVAT